MTTLVYSAPETETDDIAELKIYLQGAATIVETVAFEIATKAPAASVEELLELARGIEQAAGRLHPAD